MALGCRELFDQYLMEKLGIHSQMTGYQVVKARAMATSQEIELLTKPFSLVLHPDKWTLRDWLREHHPGISEDLSNEVNQYMGDWYKWWRGHKLGLQEKDQAYYRQAPALVVL